jgi:hypothetical protein
VKYKIPGLEKVKVEVVDAPNPKVKSKKVKIIANAPAWSHLPPDAYQEDHTLDVPLIV